MSSSQQTKSTGSRRDLPPLPVDRGWAWLVMTGNFVSLLFCFSFMRSLSIFFIEFLDKFQESATMTTLAFGLNTATFGTFSLFVPVFLTRFSVRSIAMGGSVLNAVCLIALAFAPTINYIHVIFSALGFSYPLILIPQVSLLGVYFKKRLGFAVAAANLGVSIATMLAPPLTQFFIDEYGLQGALLLHAALNLHNIPACLLLRPPSFYRPPDEDDEDNKNEEERLEVIETDLKMTETPNLRVKINGKILEPFIDDTILVGDKVKDANGTSDGGNGNCDGGNDVKQELCGEEIMKPQPGECLSLSATHVFGSKDNCDDLYRSKSLCLLNGTVEDNDAAFLQSDSELGTRRRHYHRCYSCCRCCRWCCSLSKIKESVYCNPVAILILLMAGLGANTQCGAAYMPSVGLERGLSASQASLLMTVLGVSDLCKIAFAYFADAGYVRPIYIVAVCQLVMGVTFQLISYLYGFVPMIVMCVLFGANSEVVFVLLPSIVADLLGPQYIGQIVSGFFIINSTQISLMHLLVGWLKDETGSFVGAYHVMGGLQLVSILTILMQPLVVVLMASRSSESKSSKNTRRGW